jgi:glutathione S-transferase
MDVCRNQHGSRRSLNSQPPNFWSEKPWSKDRLPLVEDRVRDRLRPLSARLGSAEWLDGGFSAGDLMMVSVLLRLRLSGILDEYPNLAAYVARGEARPAYKRAFAAQLAVAARA